MKKCDAILVFFRDSLDFRGSKFMMEKLENFQVDFLLFYFFSFSFYFILFLLLDRSEIIIARVDESRSGLRPISINVNSFVMHFLPPLSSSTPNERF